MKRFSAVTGPKIIFDDENGEEIYNKECLGEAEKVPEKVVNDDALCGFKRVS